MATLYVLLQDTSPADAVNSGADAAVCGACPQRKGGPGPQCYTHGQMIYKGLSSMWKGWRNRTDCSGWGAEELGAWLKAMAAVTGSKQLRSAAYGDIAALPVAVQEKLNAARKIAKLGARGYTHQWRDPEVAHLREWHMASVHTMADYIAAKDAGWRAFYTTAAGTVSPTGAVLCPASKEAGKLTTCSVCTLCSGLERAARDVHIPDHGPSRSTARLLSLHAKNKAAKDAAAQGA